MVLVNQARADESVVELRLTSSYAFAPASVGGIVRVPRNADNRLLRIVADSENYYRSSDINLEGENAPLSHVIWFKEMPAGHYNIEVTVFGPGGGTRGHRMEQLEVMGSARER
jgi:hypothetical protein